MMDAVDASYVCSTEDIVCCSEASDRDETDIVSTNNSVFAALEISIVV